MTANIHPAANLFPMMSTAEFKALKEDIREHGQREPVVYYRGQLLDGRNRARACKELGIEVSDSELDESVDPIAWVLSHNLHRRHLNESQRAMVATKLKKMLEPEAKERKRAGGKAAGKGRPKQDGANLPQANNSKSRDQAAAMLNVGGRSVDHASAVIEHGSSELVAAVERGEVSVSRAATIAKSTPKAQQLAAAKAKPAKAKKTPLDHLLHWWAKADRQQQAAFINKVGRTST